MDKKRTTTTVLTINPTYTGLRLIPDLSVKARSLTIRTMAESLKMRKKRKAMDYVSLFSLQTLTFVDAKGWSLT
jgi:hypothetical protein